MSTRLTYTSGDLGAETDAAFEAALEDARAAGAAPRAHLIGGETVAEGEVFERRDPARTDELARLNDELRRDIAERKLIQAELTKAKLTVPMLAWGGRASFRESVRRASARKGGATR